MREDCEDIEMSAENSETDAQVKQKHRTPSNFAIDFSSLKMNRDNGLTLAMEDLTEEDAAAVNAAFTDDEDSKVSLSEEEIAMLFMAKCEDQELVATERRAERFINLIHKTCGGLLFSLKEHGLAASGARTLAHILAHNDKYSILELCGNRLRDEGTIQLAPLFQQNDTIVKLDIRSNDIGGRGSEALFSALTNNCTLTSLDLSGLSGINRNHISIRGATALSRCLQFNKVISHLNLGSNGLGADGMKVLCAGLRNNTTLVELDLHSNNIGARGCESLAEVLLMMQSLRKLHLERNAIGDRGCSALAKALTEIRFNPIDATKSYEHGQGETMTTTSNKTGLSLLDLTENKISHHGLRELCAALRNESCRLKHLKLDRNALGDIGAEGLADLLEKNSSLKSLSVNRTEIQQRGAILIAKALQDNKSLRKLEIGYNYIDEENLETMSEEQRQRFKTSGGGKKNTVIMNHSFGTKAFATTLTTNTTLQHLDLSNNRIQNEGGYALAEALSSNRSLKRLLIQQNDLKDIEQDSETKRSVPSGTTLPMGKAAGKQTSGTTLTTMSTASNTARKSIEEPMDRCGEMFVAAMKSNQVLLDLDFSYNGFSYKSFTLINEYLKRNDNMWKRNHHHRLQERISELAPFDSKISQINAEIQKETSTEQKNYALLEKRKRDLEEKTRYYTEKHSELDSTIERLSEERALREGQLQEVTNTLEKGMGETESQIKRLENRLSQERQQLDTVERQIRKSQREIRDAWNDIKGSSATLFESLDRVTKELDEIMSEYPDQEQAITDLRTNVSELEKVIDEENKVIASKTVAKRGAREGSRGGGGGGGRRRG